MPGPTVQASVGGITPEMDTDLTKINVNCTRTENCKGEAKEEKKEKERKEEEESTAR